jgi:hypothetical protein
VSRTITIWYGIAYHLVGRSASAKKSRSSDRHDWETFAGFFMNEEAPAQRRANVEAALRLEPGHGLATTVGKPYNKHHTSCATS